MDYGNISVNIDKRGRAKGLAKRKHKEEGRSVYRKRRASWIAVLGPLYVCHYMLVKRRRHHGMMRWRVRYR